MSVGVSKTPEREEKFLFADKPFSESALEISVLKNNSNYAYNNIYDIDSMKVGYTKGGVQGSRFLNWKEKNHIAAEAVEYETDEELVEAVKKGEVDGVTITTPDRYDLKAIYVYGYKGYYPVFNENESLLRQRINSAMNKVLDTNPEYSEKLHDKYGFSKTTLNNELTESESNYIKERKYIKVAIAIDDAPYSYLDKNDIPSGIVIDFYRKMAEKTSLSFVFMPYENQEAALKAVADSTADIVGIVCSDPIQIKKKGLMLTDTYEEQELFFVRKNTGKKIEKIAAVDSDAGYISIIYGYRDPDAVIVPYKNIGECYKALNKDEVDAIICDMPQNIWLINKYPFETFNVESALGCTYNLTGAVREDNYELVNVINKSSSLAKKDLQKVISRHRIQDGSIMAIFRRMSLEWRIILISVVIGFVYLIIFMLIRIHTMKEAGKKMRDLAEIERQRNEMMSAAVDSAELILWELDLKTGELDIYTTPYTLKAMEKHNIQKHIPSALDFVLERTTKGHENTIHAMFQSMRAGISHVSEVIPFKINDSEDTLPIRVSCIGIRDEAGRPVKAYGSCKNIEFEVKKQDDYNEEITYYRRFEENDLERKLHCDLTLDSIINSVPIMEGYESVRYSEAFEHEADVRTVDGDRVAERLSVQRLLVEYSKGNRKFSLEYWVRWNDYSKYLHTDLVLVENPENGHIEVFFYVYDNTDIAIEQMIVGRMTTAVYEYVAIIEVLTERVTEIGYNEEPDEEENCFYHDKMDIKISRYVPEKYQKDVKDAISFEKVKEELEKDGTYVYSYTVNSEATNSGENGRHMMQFSYLNDEKTMIFMNILDVTAQYNREKENLDKLEEALDKANRANKAKTEFISRISHDIRTPIGIVKNLSIFAREDIHDEEMLNKDLAQIEASGKFLLSLINDVLDISKVDSGKIALKYESYSYGEFIDNIRNMLEPMCIEKDIKYEIIKDDDFEGYVLADKARLNQVALNIVSNAVKYTPEGGKVIFRSHGEKLPGNKFAYKYSVIDNGIGMSKEFQKHIFEDFMQELDNPNRPIGVSGTGLGMPIVKKMVELMNGTIEVESELGKGTTVTCSYIFDTTDEKPVTASEVMKMGTLIGNLLIAEDNSINYQIANRITGKFGLTNKWAQNGKEAVEIFENSTEGEFDVILMDVQMPVMDGLEATRRIRNSSRAWGKTIPIIAMTADAFEDAVQEGLAAGMDEYLTKPLNSVKLREALERALSMEKEKKEE